MFIQTCGLVFWGFLTSFSLRPRANQTGQKQWPHGMKVYKVMGNLGVFGRKMLLELGIEAEKKKNGCINHNFKVYNQVSEAT